MAQLTPDRLYYGVDRPIPMQADAPQDASDAQLSIALYANGEQIDAAQVPEGPVDLAGLFPVLWTTEDHRLMRAQLMAGGEPVGPPVVLQPLVTPHYARLVDATTGEPVLPPVRPDGIDRTVAFPGKLANLRAAAKQAPPPPYQETFSGIRAYVDKEIVFETTEGPITFRLRPDAAPNTAWNFRELVEGGWYTDIAFHRVLPGFVIQAGDPTGRGSGGPGYMIDLEPSTLKHDFGVLSMARSGNPNSNGAQIFICLDRRKTAGLDGLYTAFGEAVDGADAIMAIASTDLADPRSGRPVEAPRIISAHLVDAPPAGRPERRVEKPQAGTGGER